jgi:hypothetical protein
VGQRRHFSPLRRELSARAARLGSPSSSDGSDHGLSYGATGGHAEQCPQCGFERYAYNSCRNRHCPTCQTITKANWVAARRAALLPTPYFHTVLPLPHALNPLLLGNKRLLLGRLFRTARATRLQGGRQNLGGQLGAPMVLHTWDQRLQAHFHLHALVSGGALAEEGTRWIPTHPQFLFPVKALGQVFRGKLLEACQPPALTQALGFNEHTAPLRTKAGFAQLRAHLAAHTWVVYAKRPFQGPEPVIEYLGRYTHRVAIANHRLGDIRAGQVRFTSRNRHQGEQLQTLTLLAHAFIQRFLLHILPTGFVRIRHYGLLANRCKASALRQCRQLWGQLVAPPVAPPKTVAQGVQQGTGLDITRGPQYGYQPLVRTPVPRSGDASRPRAP